MDEASNEARKVLERLRNHNVWPPAYSGGPVTHALTGQDAVDALGAISSLLDENETLSDGLQEIVSWGKAYPLLAFPEPDLARAAALLEAGGMTLDAVSASNMRHVINGASRIAHRALGRGRTMNKTKRFRAIARQAERDAMMIDPGLAVAAVAELEKEIARLAATVETAQWLANAATIYMKYSVPKELEAGWAENLGLRLRQFAAASETNDHPQRQTA